MVIYLLIQLGLDRIEQVPINDGGLLASQGLALEGHLSNVKPVAKEISERTACEGNATNGLACLQGPHLGDDAPFAQVRHQQVEAAKLEIAAGRWSGRGQLRLSLTVIFRSLVS